MKTKLLFLFLISAIVGIGQNAKIDSLLKDLEIHPSAVDSNAFKTHLRLSGEFRQYDIDTARKHALSALKIANDLDSPYYIFKANTQIAITYSLQGQNLIAKKYFLNCAKTDTSILSDNDKGSIFNNLGIAYLNIGEFDSSITFHLIGLKYRKLSKNINSIAGSYNNIGLVYYRQQKDIEGREYFEKAYEIAYETAKTDSEVEKSLVNFLNNIGLCYTNEDNGKKALEYHLKAMEITKKYNMTYSLSYCYQYVAGVYRTLTKDDDALDYYLKALSISKKNGDEYGMALINRNIGTIYANKKQLQKAISLFLKVVEYYKINEDILQEQLCYEKLADFYAEIGQYKKAYKYQSLNLLLKDSLFSVESEKTFTEMSEKYKSEQQKSSITELEAKRTIDAATISQKNIEAAKRNQLIIFVVIGLIVALIAVGIILSSLKRKKKDNKIIHEQKREVESQKLIVEETHKEITDSITYAKRIQDAILPPTRLIKEWLPDSFVIYKPKDIVAGDFYWMENIGDVILFAAADCTGHGVPGAMVSVVCHNAMNRAVREFKLIEPALILDKTRELVIETFEASDKDVNDGMDIALCALNTKTNELGYAGANNNLYHIRDKTFNEIKADKQPVGKYSYNKPFTNHKIQLEQGDTIYIFSDGFADQFGGPKGKKFKYKPFRELLVANQNKTMEEQRLFINNQFATWKGDLEQIDDVCIIGVRV